MASFIESKSSLEIYGIDRSAWMNSETRLSRLWNNPGPDSGWSWVILAAGWFCMFLTFGICRSGTAGVMFVEFLAVFDTNRREAMWPFSVLGVFECIGGLLSGAISESFDGRMVLMVCAVSCTLGMALCFWAQNLTWIALCFGVLFGLGESISLTVTFTYFSDFFKKNLGTANGVYMTATPIGGFIIPVIMNSLVSRYGLRGAMLLTGGIVMHLLIAAALLRPRSSKYFPCLIEKKDVLLLPIQESNEDKEDVVINKYLIEKQVRNLLSDQKTIEEKEDFVDKEDSVEKYAKKLLPIQTPTEDNELVNKEIYLEQQTQEIVSTSNPKDDKEKLTSMEVTLVQQVPQKPFDDEIHRTYQQYQDNSEERSTLRLRVRRAITIYKTVLSVPMFYVVTVQSVAAVNILVGFPLISVDFVMDSGGSKNDGVLLVIVFSVASLAGRLMCGFISDRHYVKDSTSSLVAMFVLSPCLAIIGNVNGFYSYIALAICIGLAEGFTTTLINILYKTYVGNKGLSTSIGLRLFTNGVLAFFRPMIAGYFRNSSGSYTNFYYYLGSLSLTSGILWLFEPIFTKTKESQKLEVTEL